MASDGTIKITTELDNSQAEQAISKLGKLVKTGIATLGIAKIASEIGQLGSYVMQTGIQFESAFAGVEKTVDATDAELQQFRSGIREMSTEIPQTAADIASVAEAAGQLGIRNEYLLSFTETMSNLGVATNMSAEEAATSLARLANITQMPQENFDRLGSTIVALGNNLATTESEITDMGLRLAGAGKQVGMSEAQILGLAGAISSVGIEAEAGGSAVSTIMTRMQLSVEKGGDSLEQFANVAGMSSEEFAQAFRNNAAQALVAFVTGLGTMESRGQSAIATLSDMEITEIRQRDALLRLAGAGDVLSESLGIATQAWDENNALTNEAEKRYQTLESQIQILKNNVDDFAISLYDGIRDPMAEVVTEAVGYVERLHSAFNKGGISATVAELGAVFDDVTDDIAGTSDAAAGIVTPLKNIASVGASLAGDVLPLIGNGAKIVAENFDVALPLLASGVTAIKGYSAAKSAVSVISGLSKSFKAASKAAEIYALQLEAATYTGRMYNVQLTTGQAVVGVLTGKIKLATAAQTAWNAVMNANPAALIVTGVAAVTAGIAAYTIATEDAKNKTYELSDAEQEAIDGYAEHTNALKEQHDAREESIASIDREYSGYQSLLSELQSITDANGRVKAGYEERAKVITGQLSEALGTEISMQDGVIQKYEETIATIKDLIVQKKAEAVASSMQEDMANAYKNTEQAMQDYKDAADILAEKKKDVQKATEEEAEAEKQYNDAVEEGLSSEAIAVYAEKWDKAKDNVKQAKEAQEEAADSMEDTKSALEELSTEVDNYNALIDAMASGDTAKIESALSNLVTSYRSYTSEALASSEETRNKLYEQAAGYVESLGLVQDGTIQVADEIYTEMADAAAKTIENFNQLPGGIVQGIQEIGPEASAAMLLALEQADMDGKLSEEGKKSLEALTEAFAQGAPQTAEEIKKIPNEAIAALIEADFKGQLSAEASSAVQGMCVAIGSMSEESKSAILELLQPVLDETQMASLQMLIDGQSGGTNYAAGISSTADQAAAAGSTINASAGAGAGSGDLYGTGAASGSQYASGVSGMSGAAWGAGSTLANNADSGAGSKNPSGTGGNFGSQYAAGVGSKSGEARNQGVLLGTSAEGGAGTADGSSAGSNFGSGFVSGIGSWIKSAASKAAELASSALNAAKAALGIASPSKEMKKVGRWFDKGLEEGIKEGEAPAEAAAKELSEKTLDAFDASDLQSKLQELDIPETMARVYMAVDDKQAQAAANMISAVKAQEDWAWKEREKNQTVRLSEADIDRLAKEIAKTVSQMPIVVESVINGRVAAQALAEPMEKELKRNETTNKRLRGDRS